MRQDLLERTRAEERLVWAELRFRTLIEQIPMIVYSEEFRVGGARMYINGQVEQQIGFTAEQAGAPNFWKTRLHPDERQRVLAEEARCEETGEPFRMEYRFLDAGGHYRWVHDQCVLVRDERSGEPLFWQGALVDVTESKRVEQAIRETLEYERKAAQRLRALDEMKNTFLDAVSSFFRSPRCRSAH